MITALGYILSRSEEITGFKDLNSIEITFTTLTYYPHTQGVEFLQKISVQKGNEKTGEGGVYSAAQLYGYLLK